MKKKILAACLVVCLLATAVIGTTLAYFTDTKTVTNTFTTGNVAITLDETKVGTDGKPVEGEGAGRFTTGNAYHLLPGHTYIKDPTIHVAAGSEDCYLFVEVNNTLKDLESKAADYKNIADQMKANGWEVLTGNVYARNQKVTKNATQNQDFAVFGSFTIDGALKEITNPDDIVIKAYAVQAEGFTSAQAAWNATFGAPTAQP